MKTFFRETYQVLRVNLRQLVLFEILYRLVAGLSTCCLRFPCGRRVTVI